MIHDKSLWQKINFDFRAPIWKWPKSQKYTYPNAQKIHIQYISGLFTLKNGCLIYSYLINMTHNVQWYIGDIQYGLIKRLLPDLKTELCKERLDVFREKKIQHVDEYSIR